MRKKYVVALILLSPMLLPVAIVGVLNLTLCVLGLCLIIVSFIGTRTAIDRLKKSGHKETLGPIAPQQKYPYPYDDDQ